MKYEDLPIVNSERWMSNFINRGQLSDYFSAGKSSVQDRINSPLKFYRNDAGGSQPITYGYEVTILVDICSAIIDANRAGEFDDEKIVRNANIIIRVKWQTFLLVVED